MRKRDFGQYLLYLTHACGQNTGNSKQKLGRMYGGMVCFNWILEKCKRPETPVNGLYSRYEAFMLFILYVNRPHQTYL